MMHVRSASLWLFVLLPCVFASARTGLSADSQPVAQQHQVAIVPAEMDEDRPEPDLQLARPATTAEEPQEAGLAEVSGPALSPTISRRSPISVANIPSPAKALPADVANPKETIYADTVRPDAASRTQQMPRATRRVDDSWREPETLIEMLRPLAANGPASKWATQVIRQVNALGPALSRGPHDATAILKRLAELNRQADKLADAIPERTLARKLGQANYALSRRMDIWQEVVRLGPSAPTEHPSLTSTRTSWPCASPKSTR